MDNKQKELLEKTLIEVCSALTDIMTLFNYIPIHDVNDLSKIQNLQIGFQTSLKNLKNIRDTFIELP